MRPSFVSRTPGLAAATHVDILYNTHRRYRSTHLATASPPRTTGAARPTLVVCGCFVSRAGGDAALFVRLTGAPAGSETMRHRSGCRECATERRTCLVRPACRRNVPHETDFWNSLPADAVDFIYRYLSFVDRF